MGDEIDSLFPSEGDPYKLVRQYWRAARVQATAYGYSEAYYRRVHRYISYALVVGSTLATVLTGVQINPHIVLGVTFFNMLALGMHKAIDPKEKEFKANQIKTEMSEIAANAKQFMVMNSRTKDEVKQYSELLCEQINIWNSLSPPIRTKFLVMAQTECAKRTRNTDYGTVTK